MPVDPKPSIVGPLLLALPAVAATVVALAGAVVLRDHPVATALLAACVLVLLGVLGLSRVFGAGSIGVAAWVWAGLVWFGLPLFTGSSVQDAWVTAAEVARGEAVLAAMGTTEEITLAPPHAAVAVATQSEEEEEPPDAEVEIQDRIVLPYEGDGRRMRVPVQLVGPQGTQDVHFLFDTGATFTTLDRATLRSLGLGSQDGPELTLNTANGEVTTSLALLETLRLEGQDVDGVSVAICDDCSGSGYVGLLGLNVTGRFRTAIEHDAREVVLTPLPVDDNTVDISLWLDLSGRARTYVGVKTEVEVTARNLSSRPITEATASVRCQTGEVAVQLDDIPPGGEASSRIDLPSSHDCESFQLQLLSARW